MTVNKFKTQNNQRIVAFNKMKRKLTLLKKEHRMLTNYLSLVEDALIQEVRHYLHKHPLRSLSPPPLTPSSVASVSPISTPVQEKLDISYITHS